MNVKASSDMVEDSVLRNGVWNAKRVIGFLSDWVTGGYIFGNVRDVFPKILFKGVSVEFIIDDACPVPGSFIFVVCRMFGPMAVDY